MKISQEDGILIINIYLSKWYGARRLFKRISPVGSKTWKHRQSAKENPLDGYNCLASWQPRSGRQRSVRSSGEPVLSQEDKPKRHRSARDISCEISILCLDVHRIIRHNLQLKCFKRRRAQLFHFHFHFHLLITERPEGH